MSVTISVSWYPPQHALPDPGEPLLILFGPTRLLVIGEAVDLGGGNLEFYPYPVAASAPLKSVLAWAYANDITDTVVPLLPAR